MAKYWSYRSPGGSEPPQNPVTPHSWHPGAITPHQSCNQEQNHREVSIGLHSITSHHPFLTSPVVEVVVVLVMVLGGDGGGGGSGGDQGSTK